MIHPLWSDHSWLDVETELELLASAGAHWARLDVGWPSMQSARGGAVDGYHLNRLRAIAAAAHARGLEVQVCLVGTPSWANGGAGFWYPPTYASDFEDYVYRLVGASKDLIKYWEIGTEPNLPHYLPPDASPSRYAQLLRAAYRGAKRADPDAKVITGGIWTNDTEYLEALYAAGAKDYFDVLGLHPYTDDRSPYAPQADPHYDDARWNFRGIPRMRDVLVQHGDADKRIWITETGWTTSGCSWAVSEATQARYVAEAYQRLHEEFPYVDALIIYNLRDIGTDPGNSEHNYGVLRRSYTPKPAYDSFAQSSARWWPEPLVEARPQRIAYWSRTALLVRIPQQWGATRVTLQQRQVTSSDWTDVGTTTSSASNVARFTLAPRMHTMYRAVLPDRSVATKAATVRVRARVTLLRYPRVLRRGRYVRLYGRQLYAPGGTVHIQRRVGRRWKNVARTRVRHRGYYILAMRHTRRGTYYYRARFYTTSKLLGTYSAPVSLRVR